MHADDPVDGCTYPAAQSVHVAAPESEPIDTEMPGFAGVHEVQKEAYFPISDNNELPTAQRRNSTTVYMSGDRVKMAKGDFQPLEKRITDL